MKILDRHEKTVYTGTTPASVELKSGDRFFTPQSYTVILSMEGYKEQRINVGCSLNGWYIGNIVIGGFIGMLIVDPASGAMYRVNTKTVSAAMEPADGHALIVKNINELTEAEKADLVRID